MTEERLSLEDDETRERLERFGMLTCLEQVQAGNCHEFAASGWAPHHSPCFARLLWDCLSSSASSSSLSISSSSLPSVSILQDLSLEACHLRDAEIAGMPQQWPHLHKLNLAGNSLTSAAAQHLAHNDRIHLPVLQELFLGWNAIGDIGGAAIIRRFGGQLRILDLSGTRVIRNKAPTFNFTVPRRRRFGMIQYRQRRRWGILQPRQPRRHNPDLRNNAADSSSDEDDSEKGRHHLRLETCQALLDSLPIHMTRLVLDRQYHLGPEGITTLAQALPQFPCLDELSLQGSNVEDNGCIALAKALPKVLHLRLLNLSVNHISDDGAKSLAKSLTNTTALRDVRLVQNRMGLVGLQALLHAATVNLRLVHLTVSGHEAGLSEGSATVECLQQTLRCNRRIQCVVQREDNVLSLLPQLLVYAARQESGHNSSRLFAILQSFPDALGGGRILV